jgi:HK97 family phage portal protein
MATLLQRVTRSISGIISPKPWLYQLIGGTSTNAGENVNSNNAPTVSAVFACVSLISDTIASLPFHLYAESEDGKTRVSSELDRLVSRKPSEAYNSYYWRQAIINSLLLRGNAYILPVRSRGRITALELIDTDLVTIDTTSGALIYSLYLPGGVTMRLQPSQIIHLKAWTIDGINGLSPIIYAKETIGTAMAANKHLGGFYGNGAMPKGILQLDGSIRDVDRLRELGNQFDRRYSGSNSGKTAVLTAGAEYKAVGISMQDAQYIESMRFSVEEICRIFKVPPHKVGHLQGSSFNSSIEAQNAQFVSDCIRPLCEAIEMEFTNKLVTGNLEFELDLKSLMRGDMLAQVQRNVSYWNIGAISANEIRKSEGLAPIEDGDEYNKPLHMSPTNDIQNGTINREGDSEPAA